MGGPWGQLPSGYDLPLARSTAVVGWTGFLTFKRSRRSPCAANKRPFRSYWSHPDRYAGHRVGDPVLPKLVIEMYGGDISGSALSKARKSLPLQ